jgi:ribonuclease Z
MSEPALTIGRLEVALPNGSDGDALVHVRLPLTGRSLLFDAGDPRRLDPRDVLRLDHLFVSHCHVDHFIGFDWLVRPRVCRDDRLTCHGPDGFLDRVEARLRGYDWNLVEGNHFVVTAREVREGHVLSARFDSGRAFEREELPTELRRDVVFDDGAFEVRTAALDHRIVSRGWSLRLADRWHVDEDALAARGLAPGPWLGELKRRVEAGEEGDEPLVLPGGTAVPLARARDELLEARPGERFAYVTDTLWSERTRPRIVELARDADVFACEAPFLDVHADKAVASRHLTARQAGEAAGEAGARILLLFHVSDRYGGELSRHEAEAAAAAGPGVEVRVVPRPA